MERRSSSWSRVPSPSVVHRPFPRILPCALLVVILLAGGAARAQGLGLDLGDEEPQDDATHEEAPQSEAPQAEDLSAEDAPEAAAAGPDRARDVTLGDRVKAVQRKHFLKRGRVDLEPTLEREPAEADRRAPEAVGIARAGRPPPELERDGERVQLVGRGKDLARFRPGERSAARIRQVVLLDRRRDRQALQAADGGGVSSRRRPAAVPAQRLDGGPEGAASPATRELRLPGMSRDIESKVVDA